MTMKLYIPPEGAVVRSTTVSLNGPGVLVPVQLMQYDQQIPILAVQITFAGKPYRVPAEAEAQLRMEKPDGKYVMDPALGRDEQGTTVYFAVTRQMTAACGEASAAVEIRQGQGILGVGYIPLRVLQNPVPADAIISQDEMPAVEKLLQDTEAAAERASQAAQNVEEKLASGALQGQPGPRGEPGPAGKDGTVSFERLTDAQKASLKGEKGDPGKDGQPGKDLQPSVFCRNLQLLNAAWSSYSPEGSAETALAAGGYSYRARLEVPGADGSMVPYVTVEDLQYPGVPAAGQARCCEGGVYLYARRKIALNVLTVECRRSIHQGQWGPVNVRFQGTGAGVANSYVQEYSLGDHLTKEQSEDIRSGRFELVRVGGYWTINGRKYWAAHADYRLYTGQSLVTQHHMLIIPDVPLYMGKMNETDTTVGGYYGSVMKSSGLAEALRIVEGDFASEHILPYSALLTNAVTEDGRPSGSSWYNGQKIDLMNEQMVYGSRIWGGGVQNGHDVGVDKTQLALFRARPDLIVWRANWYWLRDTHGSLNFCAVANTGVAEWTIAGASYGVRPAFLVY